MDQGYCHLPCDTTCPEHYYCDATNCVPDRDWVDPLCLLEPRSRRLRPTLPNTTNDDRPSDERGAPNGLPCNRTERPATGGAGTHRSRLVQCDALDGRGIRMVCRDLLELGRQLQERIDQLSFEEFASLLPKELEDSFRRPGALVATLL